jgi:hypothetical protein
MFTYPSVASDYTKALFTLISCRRIFYGKLIVGQLVKIFSALYGIHMTDFCDYGNEHLCYTESEEF